MDNSVTPGQAARLAEFILKQLCVHRYQCIVCQYGMYQCGHSRNLSHLAKQWEDHAMVLHTARQKSS